MVNVLVVDDDAPTRAMLHSALEDQGLAVSEANDGRSALATLRASEHASVVLLDYLMPQHGGVEFLRAVAADPALASRHCYILMTARRADDLDLPDEVRDLLATPVIYKPFELDDLLAAVAEAARRLEAA